MASVAETAKRTVFVGSDHGGFSLKNLILAHLMARGDLDVHDVGTHSDESVHYPFFGRAVAEKVISHENSVGVIMCGTGIGISIAANKVKGVRAALCHDVTTARLCREHNNANILAMGGRTIGPEVAKDVVDVFLSTSFEGGRHATRVGLIAEIEQGQ